MPLLFALACPGASRSRSLDGLYWYSVSQSRSLRHSGAHQRLARSLLWGLGAMALLSLVAPLLSYYIDSSEVQRQLRSRGAHEARLYADSLALRILTMEAELQRIARRPDVRL